MGQVRARLLKILISYTFTCAPFVNTTDILIMASNATFEIEKKCRNMSITQYYERSFSKLTITTRVKLALVSRSNLSLTMISPVVSFILKASPKRTRNYLVFFYSPELIQCIFSPLTCYLAPREI